MRPQGLFKYFLCLAVGILLAGCGSGSKGLQGSAASVDFGSCFVGTVVTRQLYWTNPDDAQNYEMMGVVKIGDAAFSVVSPEPFRSARVPPGGKSSVVTVRFAPVEQKVYAATLSPQEMYATATHQAIGLAGEGVYSMATGGVSVGGGDVRVNAPIDFGDVMVGRTATSTFRLYNSNPQPVTLTGKWVMGGQGVFSDDKGGVPLRIGAQPSGVLSKPGKMDVTISFVPNKVGRISDAIEFVDARGRVLAGVAVRGAGVKSEVHGDNGGGY